MKRGVWWWRAHQCAARSRLAVPTFFDAVTAVSAVMERPSFGRAGLSVPVTADCAYCTSRKHSPFWRTRTIFLQATLLRFFAHTRGLSHVVVAAQRLLHAAASSLPARRLRLCGRSSGQQP